MKILIVDDEAPARARLRTLLEELGGGYCVVGEAANGEQALAVQAETEADLVLLDIRMPGMDGMQAAARLNEREPPPAVVFVTAYDQHAVEAFEKNAADYLLKPVRKQRLQKALDRAAVLARSQALPEESPPEEEEAFISVRVRGGLMRVPLNQVLYLRADQKYVTLRYQGGEELLDESLKTLERQFGDRFLRVHRNALVAKRFLKGLEKARLGRPMVLIEGCDERLEVSRRHVTEVREWLEKGGPTSA